MPKLHLERDSTPNLTASFILSRTTLRIRWLLLKLLGSNTVKQTNKRGGKIVSVLRLTVAPDRKTIHASYENKEDNTTTRSEMRKPNQ